MDINKSREEEWTQWMFDLKINNDSKKEPIELFYWLINDTNLRGSMKDDKGYWMTTSPKPINFDPVTRIVELEHNLKFIIKKSTICKALGLNKLSEKVLTKLVNK